MSDDTSKYDYKRFGCDAKRVGQAVVDILAKDNNPLITTGEIIESSAHKYREDLEKAIEDGSKKYTNPFFVIVFTHKEFWAENVVRNWFIPRQTAPFASDIVRDYPNHMKTLYMVDADRGNIKICWSLPGFQDMLSIKNTPLAYHPELVKWVNDFFSQKLDCEKFSFDTDWRDF